MHTPSKISRTALPAFMLGGLLVAAQAHAQITSASVATWASMNNVVSLAPGSSLSISDFKSKIETAFTAGAGGTIAFDDYGANGTPASSITSSYNDGRSTLTITTSGIVGTVNTAFSPDTSSGTIILGFDNNASARTFTFNPPVRVFGVVCVSRGADRTPALTFTLSDNSTVVLTDTVSGMSDNTLFNYEAAGDNKIVSVTVSMPDGFARFDDFAFATEVPAPLPQPAPEPTVIAPAPTAPEPTVVEAPAKVVPEPAPAAPLVAPAAPTPTASPEAQPARPDHLRFRHGPR